VPAAPPIIWVPPPPDVRSVGSWGSPLPPVKPPPGPPSRNSVGKKTLFEPGAPAAAADQDSIGEAGTPSRTSEDPPPPAPFVNPRPAAPPSGGPPVPASAYSSPGAPTVTVNVLTRRDRQRRGGAPARAATPVPGRCRREPRHRTVGQSGAAPAFDGRTALGGQPFESELGPAPVELPPVAPTATAST